MQRFWLMRGRQGANVSKAQRLLVMAGHGPLAIDSIFGKNTEESTRKFQQEFRLSVDGIIGPKTWEKLKAFQRTSLHVGKSSAGMGSVQAKLDTSESASGGSDGEQFPGPSPGTEGDAFAAYEKRHDEAELLQDLWQNLKNWNRLSGPEFGVPRDRLERMTAMRIYSTSGLPTTNQKKRVAGILLALSRVNPWSPPADVARTAGTRYCDLRLVFKAADTGVQYHRPSQPGAKEFTFTEKVLAGLRVIEQHCLTHVHIALRGAGLFGSRLRRFTSYNSYYSHLLHWDSRHLMGLMARSTQVATAGFGIPGSAAALASSLHPLEVSAFNWLATHASTGVYPIFGIVPVKSSSG